MKHNPGKAKRIERKVNNAACRAGHKRPTGRVREMKRKAPRTYYSWRNRRRKTGGK